MARTSIDPVDADLSAASTLPARYYTDPAILDQEQARIFARTWQLCGTLAQVARLGDFFTTEVAGEPLLITRDPGLNLRAFSNVCRHRAGPVASGAGNRRSFTCRYHGWTYSLEGRLTAAPGLEGACGFDPAAVCLPEADVATFAPFVFVNTSRFGDGGAPPPLSEHLKEVAARTAGLPLADYKLAERREYIVPCNWKVYVDNYLEGYHIPQVHPRLHRELDPAGYRVETFPNCALQVAPLRPEGGPGRRYRGEGPVLYFWIFPNLMLNFYPDHLSMNLVLPLSPDRTQTIFEWLWRGALDHEGRHALESAVELSDQVQREDIAICEAVQRGLRSRTYERGRYSPARENGVHHFHRQWGALMSAP